MKKKTISAVTNLASCIMLWVISVASTASGQYELSWNAIDGGGQTCSVAKFNSSLFVQG